MTEPQPLGRLLPDLVADLARRHGIQPPTLTNRSDMTESQARVEIYTDETRIYNASGEQVYDNSGWQNQPEAELDPICEAANLLFRHRHNLAPDVLRTLASVWSCGSAARYGEPAERFWCDHEEDGFFTDHDVDECEAENQAGAA